MVKASRPPTALEFLISVHRYRHSETLRHYPTRQYLDTWTQQRHHFSIVKQTRCRIVELSRFHFANADAAPLPHQIRHLTRCPHRVFGAQRPPFKPAVPMLFPLCACKRSSSVAASSNIWSGFDSECLAAQALALSLKSRAAFLLCMLF